MRENLSRPHSNAKISVQFAIVIFAHCAPKNSSAGDATIIAESLWEKLLCGGIGSADHTHTCVAGNSEACNREQRKTFFPFQVGKLTPPSLYCGRIFSRQKKG